MEKIQNHKRNNFFKCNDLKKKVQPLGQKKKRINGFFRRKQSESKAGRIQMFPNFPLVV